jgi:hypothetical protein
VEVEMANNIEFTPKDKPTFLPTSSDLEETELAKELGFYIHISQSNNILLRFTFGGSKLRELPDLKIWEKLVEERKKNKKIEAELKSKGRNAIKRERKRVNDLLIRASNELSLHQATTSLALEIANNPDAEKVLFGGKEIK